jgi:hypothetical protein
VELDTDTGISATPDGGILLAESHFNLVRFIAPSATRRLAVAFDAGTRAGAANLHVATVASAPSAVTVDLFGPGGAIARAADPAIALTHSLDAKATLRSGARYVANVTATSSDGASATARLVLVGGDALSVSLAERASDRDAEENYGVSAAFGEELATRVRCLHISARRVDCLYREKSCGRQCDYVSAVTLLPDGELALRFYSPPIRRSPRWYGPAIPSPIPGPNGHFYG